MSRNPQSDPSSTRGWWPLVACCLATAILLLYTSVLTVALPAIGADLGGDPLTLGWVVNAYTVALAGLLLGSGAIADACGARRIAVVGLASFTVATALCAAAPTLGWLIAGRSVQGLAAAVVFACVPALIGAAYPEGRRRAVAFAVWGVVSGGASAVGTVAGGVLSDVLGWRWLFICGLPLCVLALAASRTLPVMCALPRRIDVAGIGCATAATAALAAGIACAGTPGAGIISILLIIAGVIAGVGFLAVERATAAPMLPPSLLRSRQFAGASLVAFAYYFAAFGALPALATWMQSSLHWSATAVSTLLVTQLAAFVVASGWLTSRLRNHPWQHALAAPTWIIGIGALSGLGVLFGWGGLALLPFLLVSGFAAGIISPMLPAAALLIAPADVAAAATSAVGAARQLGLAIGVALCSALMRTSAVASAAAALATCAAVALLAGTASWRLLRRSPPSATDGAA